jgi:hypothetical protein
MVNEHIELFLVDGILLVVPGFRFPGWRHGDTRELELRMPARKTPRMAPSARSGLDLAHGISVNDVPGRQMMAGNRRGA